MSGSIREAASQPSDPLFTEELLVNLFALLASRPCTGGAEFLFAEVRRYGLASPIELKALVVAALALVTRAHNVAGWEGLTC